MMIDIPGLEDEIEAFRTFFADASSIPHSSALLVSRIWPKFCLVSCYVPKTGVGNSRRPSENCGKLSLR
jgi:hypothetical protein